MSVLTKKKKTSSMSYLLCCEKRFQILNAKLSWTAHSAVFVVSTKHKNNNNKHPNNQLQRACKRLEFFTDVKAFSPVLSVSLSINKNWKVHMLWVSDVKSLPMKGTKYFPLSHVLYEMFYSWIGFTIECKWRPIEITEFREGFWLWIEFNSLHCIL